MITYHIPVGVQSVEPQERTILSTSSGGKIIIDRTMLRIWQEADGKTDEEISTRCSLKSLLPEQVLVAVACLTEAGLLNRQETGLPGSSRVVVRKPLIKPGGIDALVSAIIVCHNSRLWLEKCLSSILAQIYPTIEIIVIDNNSIDGSAKWLTEAFPSIKLISLYQTQTLARALNLGIETARGEYYLLLNPDVELEPDALAEMLDIVKANSSCAAVTPKLRFSWAPAFINGLGNFVGAFSWGVDCALGHLDLGQFDGWHEAPSACFAATLIPSVVYQKVGSIDEGFPLYYEDSDWSYRARLSGYTILAAPKAIVYHAFGGQLHRRNQAGMTHIKLYKVNFGRLRFATKILGGKNMLRYLSDYFVEDLVRAVSALLQGNCGYPRAILRAWSDYIRSLPHLIRIRRSIQAHRECSDEILLRLQRSTPMPLIWHGMPCLTWNIVSNIYMPLLISGQTRELPEISRADLRLLDNTNVKLISCPGHVLNILRKEGFRAAFYWMGKSVQWYLMKP